MDFTKYDQKTGMITWVISADEEMLTENDFPNIPGAYDASAYFVDIGTDPPEIKERPPMETKQNKTEIKADGAELVKFSKLPKPCKVQVNNEEYQVEDGVFEWGTRLPGVYVVRVVAFPFIDWEGTVTAV